MTTGNYSPSGLLVRTLAASAWLAACHANTTVGIPDEETETSSGSGSGKATHGSAWRPVKGSSGTDLVRIPFVFRKVGRGPGLVGDSFALSLATTYRLRIEGCLTGYTANATEQSGGVLALILNDKSCLAKLQEFTIGADRYIPDSNAVGDDTFGTYLAGDTAVFVNDQTGDKLRVRVVHQISATLDPNVDVVEYSYSDISVANDTTQVTDYSAGIPITVGSQNTPPYAISSANIVGLTAGGGGQFVFELECPSQITNGKCESQSIEGIRYLLIEHGSACSTITAEMAVSMFENNDPATPTYVEAGDVMSAVASPAFKGGFTTQTDADVLTGPDELYLHLDLQLLMQATALDGGGVRCFNVHVSEIVQN